MDEKTVTRIAALARLDLAPGEKLRLGADLRSILEHFRTLAEWEAAPSLSEDRTGTGEGRLRKDQIKPSMPREDLLRNTDHGDPDGFLQVPKVIE
jgi:aspartyl/glutamyl-tRNA(Asn/Gln) amidotransferase C subunit